MKPIFGGRGERLTEEDVTHLIVSYHDELYRIAFLYLRNEIDALEALQETSYRAFKNFHTVRDPRYIKTWTIRILIHYCLDELRVRKKVTTLAQFPERADPSPNLDQKMDIEARVHRLDENYQIIVILKYYYQYTLAEIAAQLHRPLGTVKTQLRSALQQLRQHFDKEGDNEWKN